MAKQVSPGVLALRKVVDDVHKDAQRSQKERRVSWLVFFQIPVQSSQQHLI